MGIIETKTKTIENIVGH